MKKTLSALIAITSIHFAAGANAAVCSQHGNKIGFFGLDSHEGQVYASVSEHNNGCSCSRFRFRPSNTKTDMVLSILMAARLAEKKVRVDLKNASDCNSAYRIYIE